MVKQITRRGFLIGSALVGASTLLKLNPGPLIIPTPTQERQLLRDALVGHDLIGTAEIAEPTSLGDSKWRQFTPMRLAWSLSAKTDKPEIASILYEGMNDRGSVPYDFYLGMGKEMIVSGEWVITEISIGGPPYEVQMINTGEILLKSAV